MSKKVFLKIFSCIFALLFCQSYVNANPIPVFALLKYIPYSNNDIYERDYATGKNLKYYRL